MEQKIKFPQVGQTLSSGYTVIANYNNRYVLAFSEKAPDPYVVWNLDRDGDTINGRYRSNLESAQKEFADSCFLQSEKTNYSRLTEIRIIYGDQFPDCFEVLINGETIPDLKSFSFETRERELPTYKCEKYLPVPQKYGVKRHLDEPPLYQPWDKDTTKKALQKLKNSPHVQALIQEYRETGDRTKIEKFCKENDIYITEILEGF